MDRPDISRLNKNRSIFLKVGFIIALSLTVMAFNYTVYEQTVDYERPLIMEPEELVQVQRTVQKKKTMPPPPVLKASDKIIEEDIVFDPEPEPEPIKQEILVDPEPIEPIPRPVVNTAPKPPVVVPVEPVDEGPEMPFLIVEQMPRFAGCENQGLSDEEIKVCSDKKMLNYIYSNIKYPPLARDNGIEGTVVVSFVIEKNGSITGLETVRDIGGGCGAEVMRMVKKMPEWIAGEQRGRKVRVQFNLPVKFTLN